MFQHRPFPRTQDCYCRSRRIFVCRKRIIPTWFCLAPSGVDDHRDIMPVLPRSVNIDVNVSSYDHAEKTAAYCWSGASSPSLRNQHNRRRYPRPRRGHALARLGGEILCCQKALRTPCQKFLLRGAGAIVMALATPSAHRKNARNTLALVQQ